MAITAENLYQASQLEPADLGEDIINVDDSDADQRAAAIAWIDANVLPIADSEVSVPLLKATGYDNVTAFINGAFPLADSIIRADWIVKGEALYGGAVTSYGRSEINKCINSTSKTYDQDSDQDRIQGNQRLQKLIAWVMALIETQGTGEAEQSVKLNYSRAATMSVGW